jgi:uncharacterized protein
VKLRKIFPAFLAGALLLLGWAAFIPAEAGTPIPPAPSRWLTDEANFLSPAAVAEFDARLEDYERSSGHQLLVYIAKTTGGIPIEDWAVKAFEAWKVGRRGLDDGLVLFIMADDHRMRIEVGYGLEGQVPDALAGRVINDEMVSRLQQNDNDGAVRAGLDRLIGIIGGEAQGGDSRPQAPAKLTGMQKIIVGIIIIGFLILLVTNPSLALYLLFSILSGGRGGGGGGGGGWSGGGGRSGGGGASGSW